MNCQHNILSTKGNTHLFCQFCPLILDCVNDKFHRLNTNVHHDKHDFSSTTYNTYCSGCFLSFSFKSKKFLSPTDKDEDEDEDDDDDEDEDKDEGFPGDSLAKIGLTKNILDEEIDDDEDDDEDDDNDEGFPGDSLPKIGLTKEMLDEEIDEYMRHDPRRNKTDYSA
jgi:hypothetical protein